MFLPTVAPTAPPMAWISSTMFVRRVWHISGFCPVAVTSYIIGSLPSCQALAHCAPSLRSSIDNTLRAISNSQRLSLHDRHDPLSSFLTPTQTYKPARCLTELIPTCTEMSCSTWTASPRWSLEAEPVRRTHRYIVIIRANTLGIPQGSVL